jgi:hypothetical protein
VLRQTTGIIMQPLDAFTRAYDTAIADLDRWLDAHRDVARIDREQTASYWRAHITPHTAGACPVELILHRSQLCDLVAGDETYENLPIGDPARWRLVLDAIAQGRIVARHWHTQATGAPTRIETLITLADGTTWHGERGLIQAPDVAAIRQDRPMLPYRR